jgi:hypothetical protein
LREMPTGVCFAVILILSFKRQSLHKNRYLNDTYNADKILSFAFSTGQS